MTAAEKIILVLPTGEDNAIPLSLLNRVAGTMSERATRMIIEKLRRSGEVICSSEKGYYYPSNADELRRYINKERVRAASIGLTLESAEKLLLEWGEQA